MPCVKHANTHSIPNPESLDMDKKKIKGYAFLGLIKHDIHALSYPGLFRNQQAGKTATFALLALVRGELCVLEALVCVGKGQDDTSP